MNAKESIPPYAQKSEGIIRNPRRINRKRVCLAAAILVAVLSILSYAYWVRDAVVRRGIATAAARLLRKFGLETLGLKRIEVVVADGNTASRGVAEKLDAVYEGLQRMRLRVGARSYHAHMYALLAE
jgi:RimJ/RimL family protein N-acetyltransferase